MRIKNSCPVCGAPQRFWRMPASIHQAIRGGWICRGCGSELDKHAALIVKREPG